MAALALPPELLEQVHAHARRTYPEECCGLLFGPAADTDRVTRAAECDNVASRYHALDPEVWPRDNRTGYLIDARAQQRAANDAEARGEALRVIYHSHCDVGAYFSEEDEKVALVGGGEPAFPGVAYLVVSVQAGEVKDARLYVWDAERRRFAGSAASPIAGGRGAGSTGASARGTTPHPVYEDPAHHLDLLKLDLMLRGLRLEGDLTPPHGRPLELVLSDGRRVGARIGPNDAETPYLLQRRDDDWSLLYPGGALPVTLDTAEGFYRRTTPSGQPVGAIAELRGRYVALSPTRGCALIGRQLACAFCGQGSLSRSVTLQATVDDVLEAVDAALAEASIEAAFLTVGYTPDEDRGIALLEPYVRAIKKRFRILVAVDAIPPADHAWIDRTYAMGVDTLAYNLEVFDPERFRVVCPGLDRLVGRDRYLDALSYATGIFPNGAVISHLIVGLETPADTMAGIDDLTARGVVPVLPVCRPFQGKDLRPDRAPLLDEVVPVYAHLGHALARHRLNLGWVREMSVHLSPDDARALAGQRRGFFRRVSDALAGGPRLAAKLSDLRRALRVKEVADSMDSAQL
jgi:proteasome lid subunit RPN8/RPN11